MFRPAPALLFFLTVANAQIVTDRPDLTESAQAVAGVQVETGLLLEVAGAGPGGGSVDVSGPQALVRIGLGPGLEARAGLPDYRVADVGSSGADGFTEASVGAKLEVGTVGPWSVAAIAEVSVPLEDGQAASPLAIVIAGRDLKAASLGGQVEVAWDRVTDRVEVGGTAVVGTALTGRAGAFVEAAAATAPGGPAVLAQTGATLLLSDDVQLDAFVGAGLTDTAPDAFGGVGFSARF